MITARDVFTEVENHLKLQNYIFNILKNLKYRLKFHRYNGYIIPQIKTYKFDNL